MGAPATIDHETLKKLIDNFFKDFNGNPKQIKYADIANYIASRDRQYQDYKATMLRRDKTSREYVDSKIADRIKETDKLPFLLAYKTLDVEQFIKNNKSIESLRLSLSTLDEYYHKIVSIALDLQNENSALKDEIESLKKADSEIKATYKDSVSDLKEQQKERIALEKENKKLRSIIKKYVYPDIANELMAQDGLINTDTIINKTDFSSKIIHSDTDITKVIALHNSTSGSDIITDMFLS